MRRAMVTGIVIFKKGSTLMHKKKENFMNTSRILGYFSALIAGVLLSGCFLFTSKDDNTIKVVNPIDFVPKEMRYPTDKNGYRSLLPVRSDFGPAFVFSGSLTNNTISVDKIICPNLYPKYCAPNPNSCTHEQHV
jgi:hypothetical protein